MKGFVLIELPKVLFVLLISGVGIFSQDSGRPKGFTVTFPTVERIWNSNFKGKPERRFEEFEHRLSDATRLADKAELEKMLGEQLMILGVSYSKQQWIQLLVQGKGTFVNYEKRVDRIQIYKDTVVTTGLQIVDSKTSSGAHSYQFNFMNTWLRTNDGQWQCVAIAADQVKARN